MQQLLSYQTYGQRQHPALLLVHPLGTDRRFWEECVAIWEARFYCITPDLQAAGKSPRPEVPVTIPGHAADLERLRDSLSVESVVAIGCAIVECDSRGVTSSDYSLFHFREVRRPIYPLDRL